MMMFGIVLWPLNLPIVSILFYSNTTFSVEAFSGTCGALVSIACGTPGGIYKTMPLTGLTPGQVYFIRIYSY